MLTKTAADFFSREELAITLARLNEAADSVRQLADFIERNPLAWQSLDVVFIAPRDAVHSKIVSNIEEVKARGGKVIALVNSGDAEIERLADATFTIPETLDVLTPILTSIPLQLLSYYVAVARGCDVDKPRNLAKSVTVE